MHLNNVQNNENFEVDMNVEWSYISDTKLTWLFIFNRVTSDVSFGESLLTENNLDISLQTQTSH